jgi:ATP-dependent exoDNAse (exonuclease V) beta subunit
MRLLQALHRQRNHRPVADSIGRLLEATRAHVGFMLRAGGEQALANVSHVAELARQYEADGGVSFRGFIEQLRQAAQATSAAEAPIVEEGSGGVRLMTVHKAKGLEFPVVVLADLTCRLSRDEASRHLDAARRLCAVKIGGWAPHDLHEHEAEEVLRDRAEGVRLAYVAATRARDVLVVPAVGDEPWHGGWLGPLDRALYPPLDTRQTPVRPPKCPGLKSKDSVVVRPDDRLSDHRTVAPGLHAFDGYSVTWCDPRWLVPLGLKATFGVRRQDLIVKEVSRDVVASRRQAYETWRASREASRQSGRRPSSTVMTVRELADHPADDTLATVPVLDVSGADSTGRGAAFGVLVHAVLADVPLGATEEMVRDVARQHGRALGASDEDVDETVGRVVRALGHDVFVRARAADARGRCRRETPVAARRPDGILVEGVVDLAFEEHGAWIVVDYKTDRELTPLTEGRYQRQVAFYASAIGEATGQPATGLLIRV